MFKNLLLNLISPLGDLSTTAGKIAVAYKVALATFAAYQHFRELLIAQHPVVLSVDAPPVAA